MNPFVLRHTLKSTLKRGALVAAANWPVVIIQAVADSLFKVLIAMPLVGGIFLVAIVVGAEPGVLISLGWRELITTLVGSLISRPIVLAAFLASLSIVVIGGSLFIFLVKGGTIGILVRGERIAGPIERPPLHFRTIAQASAFAIEPFVESAQLLWMRYTRLGSILMVVYLAAGGLYLAAVFAGRNAGTSWLLTALFTGAFVSAITIVNFAYLLMQIVIAADDCSVAAAWSRVAAFVRRQRGDVIAVFLVVLVLVIGATGASLLATAALGLISFVPLLGLTVLPLQLIAWLFRALVFQYIGLSSVGAYLKLYRGLADEVPLQANVMRSYETVQPLGPHDAT
jgi:hypothetical protein